MIRHDLYSKYDQNTCLVKTEASLYIFLIVQVLNDNDEIFCGRKDSANKMLSRIIELEQRGYDVSGLKERANLDEIIIIS